MTERMGANAAAQNQIDLSYEQIEYRMTEMINNDGMDKMMNGIGSRRSITETK